MYRRLALNLFFCLLLSPLFAQHIDNIEIPHAGEGDQIIIHQGFSLLYDEEFEQAKWVAYELTMKETNKIYERTDRFLVDPLIKTGTANNADYAKSGFDRGHLAPAGDMGYSSTAMAESFYYSNMSPQTPGFNRGIWKRLEDLVRTWANEDSSLYVVTGPVLKKGLPTIGENKVAIPEIYYKVILDYNEPSIKGIGFIIPNASQSNGLQNFAVSIDSVEAVTGIDFFPKLPDNKENIIEGMIDIYEWTWNSTMVARVSTVKKASVSVQCHGVTKAGNRCKNRTLNESGYCYLHEYQIKN